MIKNYIQTFFLCLTLIVAPITGQASNADDDEKLFPMEASQEIVNGCIESCKKAYSDSGNLDSFSYYNRLENKALFAIGRAFQNIKGFFGGQKNDIKSAFCRQSKASLNSCYAKDSTAWGICKRAAKSLVSTMTSDPSTLAWLSSCKDTCAKDMDQFCGNEH